MEKNQGGEKFIKWCEESQSILQVDLSIDPDGFFLVVVNSNKEVDLIDLSHLRDVRTSSNLPKIDKNFREKLNYGSSQSLEEKTITLLTGNDFVNLQAHYFTAGEKQRAEKWTSHLLAKITKKPHPCKLQLLKKLHSKITLQNPLRIPLKTITKTITSEKQDRKRVEKALQESLNIPESNQDMQSKDFDFESFLKFYFKLTNPEDLRKVFSNLNLNLVNFTNFLNKTQRDPRLNEILYPYCTEEKAKELINSYADSDELSFEGFLKFLLGKDNFFVSPEKYELFQGQKDYMEHPMSHYFINSSHNTYLVGHQLTGRSSIEMYRQVLLSGCRCVELDFWNGPTKSGEEPVIVHGYTLVPDIPAKEVIEAIAECAFKTSDYPVILSFENHCNERQQAKIAEYCRGFFGSNLLDGVLEGWELETGTPLPPPSQLKNKIIIKNKKKHHHRHHHKHKHETIPTATPTTIQQSLSLSSSSPSSSSSSNASTPENSDNEDEPPQAAIVVAEPDKDKGTAEKESEAGKELSALVNYVQPVHFYSFDVAMAKNRAYEMSSFDEKQATTLLKEHAVDFVNYNKFQLSRVYPRGTRVDSTNFMPQLFWNAGCQLVALNYQTLDLAMQLNLGIFELNGGSGFVLKPEFMRRPDRHLDPFAESIIDGIVAGRVEVRIISGHTLSPRTRSSVFVEVEMYGLPADTVRKKCRTRIVQNNALNPVFEDGGVFVFKKIILPDLAFLRFAAWEEGGGGGSGGRGRFLGGRVVPVVGLRPGYRCIPLHNEANQPLLLPTLFVHILCSDYVPEGFTDLAEALANPIKFQQDEEERMKVKEQMIRDMIGEEELTQQQQVCGEEVNSSIQIPTGVARDSEPGSLPSSPFKKDFSSKASFKQQPVQQQQAAPPPQIPQDLLPMIPVPEFKTYLIKFKDKLEIVHSKPTAASTSKHPPQLLKKLSRMELLPEGNNEKCKKMLLEVQKNVEKLIKEGHKQQRKLLDIQKQKADEGVMKEISRKRKEENARLSKVTKDRSELERLKREVQNALVQRGVMERGTLMNDYDRRSTELKERQDMVLEEFERWKIESLLEIQQGSGGGGESTHL